MKIVKPSNALASQVEKRKTDAEVEASQKKARVTDYVAPEIKTGINLSSFFVLFCGYNIFFNSFLKSF